MIEAKAERCGGNNMLNPYDMTAEQLAHEAIVAARLFALAFGNKKRYTMGQLEEKCECLEFYLDLYREKAEYNASLHDCPFPLDCNQRFDCKKQRCNADECSNGYAFRRS